MKPGAQLSPVIAGFFHAKVSADAEEQHEQPTEERRGIEGPVPIHAHENSRQAQTSGDERQEDGRLLRPGGWGIHRRMVLLLRSPAKSD